MAAVLLRFRRGPVIPTTLDISEPFWDTSTNTLVLGTIDGGGVDYIRLPKLNVSNIGSLILTGDVSASNASFSDTVTISNDIIIGGSIVLGGNPVNEITFNGVLSGSIIPITGSTFNIGSSDQRYNTIYADNADITNFTASAVEYQSVLNKPTLVSGSSQIDHNTTINYTGSRHVNHSDIQIIGGSGLATGGTNTIDANVTLTLNTGSLHFSDGVIKSLPTDTISGSSQLTSSYDARYTLSGSVEPLPSAILTGSSQLTDEMYVVRTGVPWLMTLENVFNTSRFQIRRTSGTQEFIIFRKDATQTADTNLSVGDFLIYVNTVTENLIVGMALASVTTYPADLLDPAKFMRFIDTTSLL